MRVALILSGKYRDAKRCFPTIYENILKIYKPDVFISTWSNPSNVKDANYGGPYPDDDISTGEILDLYKPIAFETETFDDSQNGYYRRLSSLVDKTPEDEAKNITLNTYSMWYKRWRCNQLKKDWEEKNGFKYDVVIMCRFDIYILEPLVIGMGQDTVKIPHGYDFYNGFGDCFAYGSSARMDSLFEIANEIIPIRTTTDKDDIKRSSHRLLAYFLVSRQIPIERIWFRFLLRDVEIWKNGTSQEWKLYNDKDNHFYTSTFDHVYGQETFFSWDFIFNEIYDWEFSPTRCIYEMWDCRMKEEDIVVDLGASIGFFSKKAAQIASHVIAVDGSPENFSCLVENTKDNLNVSCLNACVTGDNSPTPYLWSRKGNPLHISMEKLFQIYNLEKIDFLKCDIEGGEYDLFACTPQHILDRIDRIAIETHDEEKNLNFSIPGKVRHDFTWWYAGGKQTMIYFTTPN